jgi:hypothetical protein
MVRADETFDPCPELDVLAFSFLRMFFADFVLLGVDYAARRRPTIGVISCGVERL